MNKKVLISIAVVLIVLASISTFYDFSKGVSGKTVAPAVAGIYVTLTALVLIALSVFLVTRRK